MNFSKKLLIIFLSSITLLNNNLFAFYHVMTPRPHFYENKKENYGHFIDVPFAAVMHDPILGESGGYGDFLNYYQPFGSRFFMNTILPSLTFHPKVGLTDFFSIFGYRGIKKKKFHLDFKTLFLFPTSEISSKTKYLHGNKSHWGFGIGIDTTYQVLKDENKSFEIALLFNHKYNFKGTDTRLLGIKGTRWASSFLIYDDQIEGALLSGQILMQNVEVRPGNLVELYLDFSHVYKNWTFYYGYSLSAKENENVRFKNQKEFDDRYSFAMQDGSPGPRINSSDLDLSSIEKKGLISNSLYAGFDYSFNKMKTPLVLGLGSLYAFSRVPSNDSELWMLYGKLGLKF